MDGEARIDGRTLRYQHRRPELLAAAAEYVLDRGLTELSLRPAARELGVTHATLLRHFGTKEELIVAVVEHVRVELHRTLASEVGDLARLEPADALRAIWRELCRPPQRRQFLLLFELVAMQAREPERFGALGRLLVADFLEPLERNLRHHGRTRAEARDVATAYLALLRGLQLDLAVSGDQARADAAMRRYVDQVTTGRPAG